MGPYYGHSSVYPASSSMLDNYGAYPPQPQYEPSVIPFPVQAYPNQNGQYYDEQQAPVHMSLSHTSFYNSSSAGSSHESQESISRSRITMKNTRGTNHVFKRQGSSSSSATAKANRDKKTTPSSASLASGTASMTIKGKGYDDGMNLEQIKGELTMFGHVVVLLSLLAIVHFSSYRFGFLFLRSYRRGCKRTRWFKIHPASSLNRR